MKGGGQGKQSEIVEQTPQINELTQGGCAESNLAVAVQLPYSCLTVALQLRAPQASMTSCYPTLHVNRHADSNTRTCVYFSSHALTHTHHAEVLITAVALGEHE